MWELFGIKNFFCWRNENLLHKFKLVPHYIFSRIRTKLVVASFWPAFEGTYESKEQTKTA